METLLGLVLIGIIYVACKVVPEQRFNNYMPPEGQKIDYNAQALDRVTNHLTDAQVKQNTINGKYNRPKEDWEKRLNL